MRGDNNRYSEYGAVKKRATPRSYIKPRAKMFSMDVIENVVFDEASIKNVVRTPNDIRRKKIMKANKTLYRLRKGLTVRRVCIQIGK